MSDIKSLKVYRSFRISVHENDNVGFRLFVDKGTGREEVKGQKICNLSLTGLGFYSRDEIGRDQYFVAHLTFKGLVFEIPGTLIRCVPIYNEYGECEKYFCGLEFQMANQIQSKKFIEKFISSFSLKRLKDDLAEIVVSEGEVSDQSYRDKISLLISLHNDMRKFEHSENLTQVVFKEAKRLLRASEYRFYFVNAKKKELSFFNFEKNAITSDKLTYKNSFIEKSILNKVIVNLKVSSIIEVDPFYRSLGALYSITTKNSLIVPVKDDQGNVSAVIEFTNKLEDDFFGDEDEVVMEVFSQIVSSIRSEFHKEPENFDVVEIHESEERSVELIGISETTEEMRKFVDASESREGNVLIWGEFGVGKKHFAQVVHKAGIRESMPLGVINCHDFLEKADIEYALIGNTEHVGKLELYSGGGLIVKDVCSLKKELQVVLYEILNQRSDIHLLATATHNLERRVKEGSFNQELYQLIAVHQIRVPPIRERKEDVLPLMQYYMRKICRNEGLYVKKFGSNVVEFFKNYDWPGNIQEIKTAIERLITYNFNQHVLESVSTKVTPVIGIDQGQLEAFTFIFGLFSNLDLEHVSREDFDALYFYVMVGERLKEGVTLNQLALEFDLSNARIQEKIFHSEEVAKKYFGPELLSLSNLAA